MELVWGDKTTTWKGWSQIGSIYLDASVDELHSMSAEVTDHPIETGSNITDHVHTMPRIVRIDGLVSNHPIDLPPSHALGVQKVEKEFTWKADPQIPLVQVGGPGVIGGVTGAIASAVGADQQSGTAMGFEPVFDRVQSVLEEFEAIHNEKRIIDIVTTLKVYNNMVIETLDITRSAQQGRVLPFSATARQITIVETGVVPAPVDPAVQRGKPESAQGRQSAEELADSDPASEITESLAHKALF